MNPYKKLGKNISIISLGSFASKIISFLFVPFYTAVLQTEEFGIADMITTTFSLILPFFSLEIRAAMMRFALDKAGNQRDILKTGTGIMILSFFVVLLCSPLALLVDVLREYYGLLVFYYLAFMLQSGLAYFVRGIELVKIYAIGGVINIIALVLLNIVFLLGFDWGVFGYLLAYSLAYAISFIYMFISGRIWRLYKGKGGFDKKLAKEMLKYCVPLVPNSISWWVSNSSDKYILSIFCGAALTGVYAVAYKIPSAIHIFITIFYNAWSISAVDDFGSEKTRRFYSDVYNKFLSFMILAAAGMIWWDKLLAKMLYSKDFYQAWKFVPILVIAVVVHGAGSFIGSVYTSAKKTGMILYSTIAGAVVNVVLNFIMIPVWGGFGAALATVISYGVIWIIRMCNARKIMKLDLEVLKLCTASVLLIAQCVVITTDMKGAFWLAGGLCVLICLVFRKFISEFIGVFIRKLTGKKAGEKPGACKRELGTGGREFETDNIDSVEKSLKKVGIVTYCTARNYGSVLQSVALQTVIKNKGFQPETIIQVLPKAGFFTRICGLLAPERWYSLSDRIRKAVGKRKSRESLGKIARFKEEKIQIKYIKDFSEIIQEEYGCFVAGSDQIWSTLKKEQSCLYTLTFVNESKKKYSYAASIGPTRFTLEQKQEFKGFLSDFAGISVREEAAKSVIEEIIGKEIHRHLDPVFLVGRPFWESLAVTSRDYSKSSSEVSCGSEEKQREFIFIYQLRPDKSLLKAAKCIAKEKNLDIIYISMQYVSEKGVRTITDAGVEEFLGYIKNAKYVITNSFHGTALSMIFHKKFLSFAVAETGYRAGEILELAGLKNHLIGSFDRSTKGMCVDNNRSLDYKEKNRHNYCEIKDILDEEINYDTVEEALRIYKDQSLKYLDNVLESMR